MPPCPYTRRPPLVRFGPERTFLVVVVSLAVTANLEIAVLRFHLELAVEVGALKAHFYILRTCGFHLGPYPLLAIDIDKVDSFADPSDRNGATFGTDNGRTVGPDRRGGVGEDRGG